MSRLPLSPVVRFVLKFALIYGLLIAPWPGWNAHYGAWIRALGETAFSFPSGRWLVRFDPLDRTPARPLDTRIVLADRTKIAPDGSGPAVMLDFDARGVGWIPTALWLSLTLATSLPWRRRLGALLWGFAGIHAFILLAIGAYILNHCDPFPVSTLAPIGKTIAAALEETLVNQMGTGFAFAALLWLAVAVRQTELASFFSANPGTGGAIGTSGPTP